MAKIKVTSSNIEKAIETIGKYHLGKRLDAVDGDEAHRILPEIWPIIRELRLLADACESKRLQPSI